jgi:purine-binding chemotaxis protein CheW
MMTLEKPTVPAAGAIPGPVASATPAAPAAGPREVLTFRLGEEDYGVDILRVQEIRSFETCTALANTPAFIKGVVNLRGVIVPIIDLRLKFGMAQAVFNDSTVTIVLNVAHRVVGVVVDSVSDVLQLAGGQIHPPPAFNGCVQASYITGVATVMTGDAKRMLILVDIERLMTGLDMGLFETSLQ